MTTYKMYSFGPYKFKTYLKPVGYGWEVGMIWKDKSIFVGNFIHKYEATSWWKHFNTQAKMFFKKYEFPFATPKSFYTEFMTNHFYSVYYNYLDKLFKKHTISYEKACVKDMNYYRKMKKTNSHFHYNKAA